MLKSDCPQSLPLDLFENLPIELHPLLDQYSLWDLLDHLGSFIHSVPKSSKKAHISPLASIESFNDVHLGNNVVIEPGAFIQGPCWIGDNTSIRQGAYIRGPFFCGSSCVIGHTTEVKGSIFGNNTKAPHFAYVGDSILGGNVNLGAGVKIANLKLDRKPVVVRYKGQRFATGRKKLGAIIGDGVQIGCNSVINPGTVIAKNQKLKPLSNYSGYISKEK